MKRYLFSWLGAGLAAGLLCASTVRAAEVEPAQFHHFHLNVINPADTVEFYRKGFGAVPIRYRNLQFALLTDRSFILMNQVDSPAPFEPKSAIMHAGWGGVEGQPEFEWLKSMGVEFETPITALGSNFYMYAYGPDKELVEVWTGFKHHRFGHMHLYAEDVNLTTQWYMDRLGLNARRRTVPRPDSNSGRRRWSNAVTTPNGVTINIFARREAEGSGAFEPTRGRVIDHMGFSYREIEPVLERMEAAGVEIVAPIAVQQDYMLKSFFVMGPDKVLIEIVEEKPIPEGIWD